jgi:hypothetical protein
MSDASVNNFSHYLLGLLLFCSDQVKNNYRAVLTRGMWSGVQANINFLLIKGTCGDLRVCVFRSNLV